MLLGLAKQQLGWGGELRNAPSVGSAGKGGDRGGSESESGGGSGDADQDADEDDLWWAPKSPKTGADARKPVGTALHRGRLEKRGQGTSLFGRKNWKTRYFVLYENLLVYFASEGDASTGSPLGELPLAGCTLQFNPDQRQFVLGFPSGRVFEMRGLDEAAFRSWKERLVELAALKLSSP